MKLREDFNYCKGKLCALKGNCKRYVEGMFACLEEEAKLWFEDCGEDRIGYIENK